MEESSDVHIDGLIDINYSGVFRPTKGSRLREVLEENTSFVYWNRTNKARVLYH